MAICVYRHIRLDKNEPFYIGIGSLERAHKKGRNKYWNNVVKKTEYRVDILFDDLTWEEACEKEKEFIQLYGRKDLGTGTLVNMTDGGEGICNPSDESRLKISKANKGRKHSDEIISKILKSRMVSHKKKIKGIHWSSCKKKWISQIQKNKNLIQIGSFDCFGKALISRKKAEIEIWDNNKDHFIKKTITGIHWDKVRNNWMVRNKKNYVGSSQHFCKALMMLKKSKEL